MDVVMVFVFGLAIGSFLLVLIDRLPKGKPVLVSRSVCDYCKHVLSPFDLVPVFSYVFLSGRCRYCHKKLSMKYPFMEILTGLSLVLLYSFVMTQTIVYPRIFASDISLFLFLAVVFATLIVIFFTDLFDGIIPFGVVLVGVLATSVYLGLSDVRVFLFHLLIGVLTALFFLAIYLGTKKRGIGFGDVVYGFYMGFLLGFPFIIIGLYIAFLTGAVVSLILVLTGRKKLRGDTVPFGPFLIFGTVIALLWGQRIWEFIQLYIGL